MSFYMIFLAYCLQKCFVGQANMATNPKTNISLTFTKPPKNTNVYTKFIMNITKFWKHAPVFLIFLFYALKLSNVIVRMYKLWINFMHPWKNSKTISTRKNIFYLCVTHQTLYDIHYSHSYTFCATQVKCSPRKTQIQNHVILSFIIMDFTITIFSVIFPKKRRHFQCEKCVACL